MMRTAAQPIHLTWLLRLCLLLLLALGGMALFLSTAEPIVAQSSSTVHVVQRGETLSAIAARYGMPYRRLADYNGILNPNHLYVGQVIRIPTAHISPATPVPQRDPFNNVAVPSIRIDTQRSQPVGRPTVASAPAPEPAAAVFTQRQNEVDYTVHRGDSIYSIAARYTVSPEAIVQRNNLPSTVIYVGQRLIIPTSLYASSQVATTYQSVPVRATPTPHLPQPSISLWMTPRLMNAAPVSLDGR